MAERTNEKKLTTSELIVQKLKETFDRSGDSADSEKDYLFLKSLHEWLMGIRVSS